MIINTILFAHSTNCTTNKERNGRTLGSTFFGLFILITVVFLNRNAFFPDIKKTYYKKK